MAKAQSKLPAVTLVIEWENAIDVADEWTHRAMDALEREIEAVAPRMPVKPRIMYLYDATAVEPEVIEVYGDDARAWAEGQGRALSARLEMAGETAFCYARDPQPLLAALAQAHGVRYLHRPANLEDLFIKLTGRELRD